MQVPRSFVPLMACTVVLLSAGCRQKAAPIEVRTTTGVQPRAESVTAVGCLKSGTAGDTFVVMASQSTGDPQAVTYHFDGKPELNARAYVGQQVEVSGIVRAEEDVRGDAGPVEQKRAVGTGGTPSVETKTELDVKQLDVSSIKPLGGGCK